MLQTHFQHHQHFVVIKKSLTSPQCSIVLDGLHGSSKTLVLAATAQKGIHFLICNDYQESVAACSDLMSILQEEKIFFFPSSIRFNPEEPLSDASRLVQRTSTLSLFENYPTDDFVVIVTYPEAIAEKIVSQTTLQKNTLQLKVGENVGMDFLLQCLTEYGFEKTDFVFEPGQFAQRGSIVDIFSFADHKPFRIDFFDDVIESIRAFDLETQLSYEKVTEVSVIADMQSTEIITNKVPFYDYFLPSSKSSMTFWVESVETLCKTVDDSKFNDILSHALLVGFNPYTTFPVQNILTFHTTPQPSFHKNFTTLRTTISDFCQQQYAIQIFTDSEAQSERLTSILCEESAIDKTHIAFIQQSLSTGFEDHDQKTVFYTEHQIFERYHQLKIRNEVPKAATITIQEFNNLQIGDYVVHIDHGIGVYGGLISQREGDINKEFIRINYREGDVVLVNVHSLHRIAKYRGKEGSLPNLDKLGSSTWQKFKHTAKSKVKEMAKELIQLYAQRQIHQGFAFSKDSVLQHQLEASFMFEDTPDQHSATQAVKRDMEKAIPMDRLICGDVGFGKTEVAMRAAFKAVVDGKQVALLVPTTILAMQHHRSFSKRFKEFPVRIELLTRKVSAKKTQQTLDDIKKGGIDILIGTHKILGKEIQFKDLGLLIIDEEHKFGVAAKEKLRTLKHNVDTLTLTATPIPRTLQFSLMGSRDMSVIRTPPPNRRPIHTEVQLFSEEIIRDSINAELERRGQVFFIHNNIEQLPKMVEKIRKLIPKATVVAAHGQMVGDEVEKILLDFIVGDIDVLVTTTIVENGLDIPNANTMIINNAHKFGLSELHQLRGRVGRSNRKAYCHLLTKPDELLTVDAQRRLKAITEFSELGSGFHLAMQDLDIRGAGNLLGTEQSGFIMQIGYETYQRILEEAMIELRATQPDAVVQSEASEVTKKWVADCTIDIDMEAVIPNDYVYNTEERMRLYREIDRLESLQSIVIHKEQLADRFGKIPQATESLYKIVELRLLAMELAMEKIVMKNGMMVCYFTSNEKTTFFQSPTFTLLMKNVASQFKGYHIKPLRDNRLSIVIDHIKNLKDGYQKLAILKKNELSTVV